MKKYAGFTIIELVIFIVITSILGTVIVLAIVNALLKMSSVSQQNVATQTARQCMEYYLGQRRLNGYSTLNGANCTAPLTLPAICSVPTGYTLVVNCVNTTISGDSNYNTITATVTGSGSAILTYLIGKY